MKDGWQTKSLGDVCEVINGGTPKTGVAEYWDGSHLWITPAEMGKRLSPYVSDTERKITDTGLRDSSARILPPNSVILSSRAPIGHLVINTKPMATNQGCKGLVSGRQLHHKFLYYYLTGAIDLLNSLGTGATFKELSSSKLKDVAIPVPSLSQQLRIVTSSTKRSTESPRPKPTLKRTSKTPAPFLRVTSNTSLRAAMVGLRRLLKMSLMLTARSRTALFSPEVSILTVCR